MLKYGEEREGAGVKRRRRERRCLSFKDVLRIPRRAQSRDKIKRG